MRIFACFIVIGCHVRLEPVINGELDRQLLMLHGFYDDGVAVFFMIIGFFLSTLKVPFWKYVGKTLLRILIPVFLLLLFLQVFSGWIVKDASFAECIMNPAVDITQIIKAFASLNFLLGEQGSRIWGMTAHLWYITYYLRIAVALPLLSLIALDNHLSKKACKWLVIINVISMLFADIQHIFPQLLGSVGSFAIFDVSITYVIIGYTLYKNRYIFAKHRILLIAGMVGINVVRFALQCILFSRSLSDNYFAFWNTVPGLIFAVCFVGFFLTFPEGGGNLRTKTLNYIGAKTYFIYLVHIAAYTFMDFRGVRDMIYSVTVWRGSNLAAKIGYDVAYPVVIFAVCLAIAMCIDFIKEGILALGRNFLSKNGEKDV